MLETRDTTTESDQPENLQPDWQYVWSARYIDAAVLRDKNTDADGLCDDERLYYLGDANFNVTTLVDTNGDAVERYLYDPYGTATIYDGSWTNTRSTSSYANVVRYTGREWDGETGIYLYRHRFYAAEVGRFASRDPIGYQGGINIYRYVDNRPLILNDPTGKEIIGGGISTGAGFCFPICLPCIAGCGVKIDYSVQLLFDIDHRKCYLCEIANLSFLIGAGAYIGATVGVVGTGILDHPPGRPETSTGAEMWVPTEPLIEGSVDIDYDGFPARVTSQA